MIEGYPVRMVTFIGAKWRINAVSHDDQVTQFRF